MGILRGKGDNHSNFLKDVMTDSRYFCISCNFMKELDLILANRFSSTEERIEDRLVYLIKYGLTKINVANLEQKARLTFYKAKFFTGYRKFSIIDVIIGANHEGQIFLLTNPLFSVKYSDLITQFENIYQKDIDQCLINEIIELYKIVGTNITEIDATTNLYQIWFGNTKWRKMKIDIADRLTIKITRA